MSEANNEDVPIVANSAELERFRKLRWLANHWSRPIGPPIYYWYLTFENSPELHHLARKCQEAISFPYYDLIPLGGLHLSLDRIAFEDDITLDQLRAIEITATSACREIAPLGITVGALGGTRSAIGFTASPGQ